MVIGLRTVRKILWDAPLIAIEPLDMPARRSASSRRT
jgi:hypothetical protein